MMLTAIATNRLSEYSPDPLADWWYGPVGRMTASGMSVTEDSALKYSAVVAATRVITESIASLPCSFMRKRGNSTEVLTNDMLHELVHDEPNPEQDSMLFFDQQIGFQVNWGNAYAEKEMAGNRTVNLWPIHPSRLPPRNIRRNRDDLSAQPEVGEPGELVYYVRNDDGSETPIPASRMLHIPGILSDNGVTGKGIVRLAAESIGLGLNTEKHAANHFGSGAVPKLILKHPKKMSEQAHQNLRDSWKEGLAGSSSTKIIEDSMDVVQIAIPPEASQLVQSRKLNVLDIGRWYRVPPHMLGDLDDSTKANIEEQSINLVVYTLLPWVRRWEKGMKRQLLRPEQKRQHYFLFNVNGLLRGDAKTRAEFYHTLFQDGVLSPNDIRAREDMNPVPGGDNRFVQINMQTLERAAEFDPMAKATARQERTESRMKELKRLMADMVASAEERDNRVTQSLVQLDLASGEQLDWFSRQMIDKLHEYKPRDEADREVAMQAVESMRDAAVAKMKRSHATAAKRAAKKPDCFLQWNDDFAANNRQKFIDEFEPVAEVYAKLGERFNSHRVVDEHLEESHRELLEASGDATAETLGGVVGECVGKWNGSCNAVV